MQLEYGDIDAAGDSIARAWGLNCGALGGFVQRVLGDVHAARGAHEDAHEWWTAAAACGSERARLRLEQ